MKKASLTLVSVFLILVMGVSITACGPAKKERTSLYVLPSLLPYPKAITGGQNEKGEYLALSFLPTMQTEVAEWEGAKSAFFAYASKLHALSFAENKQAEFTLKKEEGLAKGAYRIESGENGVILFAAEETGINNALSTLLQLVHMEEGTLYVPAVTVSDAPSASFRSMMVDVGRSWHPLSYLLDFVDMCYYYRVSHLHLHFTENISYTLPSSLYPNLPTQNRHYTKQEIQELAEYANARGVQLVPEIDVPGHCEPFEKAYPQLFGTGNIIHQHEDSLNAMKALFQELCDMFPYSEYIHIGGDEADITKWITCRECREYFKGIGMDIAVADRRLLAEQMLAHFIGSMADVVMQNGRTPIVWEGFAKEVNHLVSKDIVVMSWENYYQTTQDLLAGGYKIINASWNPMYVVTPVKYWTQGEVFAWDIYSWKPVHNASPHYPGGFRLEGSPTQIIGGQLLAWGDQIEVFYPDNPILGVNIQRNLLLERLPALAENTWNTVKLREYKDFTKSYRACAPFLKKLLRNN